MTNRKFMRQLKKTLRDQRGFTLIELLVVLSILGILAAVVTMSMVGITKMAQDRAAKTELQTVQTAYDTMLADQGIDAGNECGGAPTTDDMTSFPSNTQWSAATDGNHTLVALSGHYLRQNKTHGVYQCTTGGLIKQTAYNP